MADVTIPSEEEIGKLPRWAQVAFAARCARRTQPLFIHFWPDAPKKHLDAVDAAVRLAENCASTARLTTTDAACAHDAVAAVSYAAFAAEDATNVTHAAITTNKSTRAAQAAAFATRAAINSAADDATTNAANAAGAANLALNVAIDEIGADLELLLLAATTEQWDNNTPVAPEFFGPMWPNGTPDGWPPEVAVDEAQVLKLQIAVPQDMNNTQSRDFNEKVKAFLTALSAFDASMGGTGLQILDDASNEYVDAKSEEPIEEHHRPLAGVGA